MEKFIKRVFHAILLFLTAGYISQVELWNFTIWLLVD